MDDLKYIYVIEFENGEGRKKTRVHHHVIMSGMNRDAAERLWTNGWANTRRLQPDEYGLEAPARYIVKDPKGKKAVECKSKPQRTESNHSGHKVYEANGGKAGGGL